MSLVFIISSRVYTGDFCFEIDTGRYRHVIQEAGRRGGEERKEGMEDDSGDDEVGGGESGTVRWVELLVNDDKERE